MNSRRIFGALALIPLALIAEGLILQHFKEVAPCPLCVLQRAGFLLYALIALGAAMHGARRGALAYASALALTALCGLGVALRHIWVLYHPKLGCGIDVLEEFVNGLPTAKALPWLLRASGECTAKQEPLLGLQVPEWSAVWFALLALAALWAAYTFRQAKPDRNAA